MQRTMRKGHGPTTGPRSETSVEAPAYPLLRMTITAMVNLAVAYSTLLRIPMQIEDEARKLTDTLPSLSWTIVSLFILQTVIGLVLSYIHASNKAATRRTGSGAKRDSKSSSTWSAIYVVNISIAIGAFSVAIYHIFEILFGAAILEQAKETSQLACYLALLSFYPAAFILGTDLDSWLRVFLHSSPHSFTEVSLYCQGAFAFYCVGTVVGLVTGIVMKYRTARREFGADLDESSRVQGKKVKTT
ncbi:hypothetical protein BGW38_005231 [Lunasporangiospora selenospora]|uniref:Uncharacterized protein n=1 Tax=Lunasporangiospora selenospora TaxID=979761 RepID=A0A9P6G044_9FUNG|nr:hypothetical protein BGW38_005231 [Lunasporangiospora selenospora]